MAIMVSYAGKLCLAPMVRSGELPTRLMALRHGADLVWLPEIVDRKIRTCLRVENAHLNTVDFVDPRQPKTVIFRTDRVRENGRLIFQLGLADPDIAVEGALKVVHDVDGIDLNCGCPKPFLTHAGMGAALLSKPELLTAILRKLVEKVGTPHLVPISAKIRLLSETDAAPTLELVRQICATGVANLTVHCRTRAMRNRQSPVRQFVGEIYKETARHNVSLVVNGGFSCRADFERFRAAIGIPQLGGMFAESAELNPTIFGARAAPWGEVVPEFVETAMRVGNNQANTKYILLNQVPGKLPYYQKICKVKTHEEFLAIARDAGSGAADEGGKVFVRTMMKDRLYAVGELEASVAENELRAQETKTSNSSENTLTDGTKSHLSETATGSLQGGREDVGGGLDSLYGAAGQAKRTTTGGPDPKRRREAAVV